MERGGEDRSLGTNLGTTAVTPVRDEGTQAGMTAMEVVGGPLNSACFWR